MLTQTLREPPQRQMGAEGWENRGTRIEFAPHLNGVSPFVRKKDQDPSSSLWIYRFNDAPRAAIRTLANNRDELPSSFFLNSAHQRETFHRESQVPQESASELSCRRAPCAGSGRFVTGVGLRVVLPMVAEDSVPTDVKTKRSSKRACERLYAPA
jgi:hypothetical protein